MAVTTDHTPRIVVGIDGSEESFAALAWAIDDARRQDTTVNAVYGWTPSWEVGIEPDNERAWDAAYHDMESKISQWVSQHYDDPADVSDLLTLTSVRGTGQSALLTLGASASQIVVGRRDLSVVVRWFVGSTSATLVSAAKVPVTVITTREQPAATPPVDDAGSRLIHEALADSDNDLPVVVGIDGSSDSVRALRFAIDAADRTGKRLHVLFCWQLADLGVVPGYENSIAPEATAQAYAEDIVRRSIQEVDLPAQMDCQTAAVNMPAAKGLALASREASWLVMGSRGLSGLDARVLGSVSARLVHVAQCPLTVVH